MRDIGASGLRKARGPGGSRPARIVYVIGTLDVGGAETQLVSLVLGLDRTRFEPVVCALSSGGLLEDTLRTRSVPLHVPGFRGIWRDAVPPLWRFAQIVRDMRPDIVHGFLYWGYVLGALVARAVRVPVVIASRRSLGSFKAGKPHYLVLERLMNRMTDLVVANSEAVRQDTLRQERMAPEKVIVIHNGVDVTAFLAGRDDHVRQALGVATDAPMVAVIANFHPYKGHEDFLTAWASVVSKRPEAVAVLAGEGPLRGVIEARIRALGLGSSVRVLGLRRDVPALLAASDLVVHPSREEGFPNAILEAMATGKPVVATAVGGTPEAVRQGETGLLVPPRDVEAMRDAVLRLLANPEEARALGEAGRQVVTARFELSGMVRRYEAVYERLLAGRR